MEKDSIYFAVKTCEKYHKERVPVVKKTWAQYASNVEFFSDEAGRYGDTTLAKFITIVARRFDPHHQPGHPQHRARSLCQNHRHSPPHPRQAQAPPPGPVGRGGGRRYNSRVGWIIPQLLTLSSFRVSRIQQLLTCYNATKLVALGERYGYNVHSARGYNYITGGGGMVFSRALLKQLTRPGVCECPSISAPDDMFLGLCIASLGVSVTHSPLFHQVNGSVVDELGFI